MNELLVKPKVTTGVENERTADPSPEAWLCLPPSIPGLFCPAGDMGAAFRY
jgi:hypothetical protein